MQDDLVLNAYVAEALRRLDVDLAAALPDIAPKVRALMPRAPSKPTHVLDVRAFPIAALPYWLSPEGRRDQDAEFQIDMISSSLSGYYAIRLCDDIADDDCAADLRKLAPCTLYFDKQAIRPYMKHFSADHEFWPLLDRFAALQAQASAADAWLDDIDETAFAAISSRKFTGTKIPLSAVRCRYAMAPDAFARWLDFVDALGSFTQFNNDFFDWRRDSINGNNSYLSCEARRQAPDLTVETWFMNGGFEWGLGQLKSRLERATVIAETLGNARILVWLAGRSRTVESDAVEVKAILEVTRKFANLTSHVPF